MRCPKCDGMGDVCDNCDEPMSVSQDCEECGKTFCAIAVGVGTDVLTGRKVDMGFRDCFTGHHCTKVGRKEAI